MFYEGFGKSMKEEIKNYTYMLLCADGTYYTGWTNQIRKRIRAHNSGKGAKYTKGRGPLKLVYLEIFGYERGGNETGGCHKKADAEGKRGADTDGGIPGAGASGHRNTV